MTDRPARSVAPLAGGRAHRCLLAALLVTTAVALAGAPSAAAPPDPSTAAAVATEGPDPTWAVDAGVAGNLAVDPAGTTFVTSKTVLLRTFTPGGAAGIQVVATGAGTLHGYEDSDPPSIAVAPDAGVFIAGEIQGSVTIGTGPGAITLHGGGTESAFVLRLEADGRPVWGRTFAANDVSHFYAMAVSGDVVAVTGDAKDPFTIAPLPTTLDDGDGYVVGFDATTGTPSWLTEINTADVDADFGSWFGDDMASDDDSFAVLGDVYASDISASVRGAGTEVPVGCDPSCDLVIDLDAATGAPQLVKDINQVRDIYPSRIAMADGGYVVLSQDNVDAPPREPSSVVTLLDAAGLPIWSSRVYGAWAIESGVDLAVDANGDVILAASFDGGARIGDDPGAPTIDGDGSLLIEWSGAGDLKRYSLLRTPAGWASIADQGLGIDRDDGIRLHGMHTAAIQLGTGPGSITIPGSGAFLASYAADVAEVEAATFTATPPTRLLDSRTPTGGWNGKLVAGTPRPLAVAGVGGVPANATAVVLNLTATDVTAMTFLAAWPTGTPQPTASNLNVLAGDTIANHATVRVGNGGTITLATAQGAAHVVADVFGYYTAGTAGDRFHPITPARLLDSRTPTGGWNAKLAAGTPRPLTVAGTAAVPADASTVVLSVTATDTSALTYLRVEPSGAATSSSNLNINPGQTITNLVTTPIGTGGQVTFTNNTGTVNVVADAVGYYRDDDSGATFHAIRPTRVLDSRLGTGVLGAPWGPGSIRTVPVDQVAPPGTDVVAVTANLAATDTSTMSFATLYPQAPKPGTSNLIWAPGQTIASATATGVAPNGTVSLFNQLGTANFVLDISGYFVPAT